MRGFIIGDRVKLTIKSKYCDEDNNPIWDGRYGKVVGTVKTITYGIAVLWDNGTSNTYELEDLELISLKEFKKKGREVYLLIHKFTGDIRIKGIFTEKKKAVKRCINKNYHVVTFALNKVNREYSLIKEDFII